MHFHLPKPLHGWRAFAGEVGIIVLGVLIALGAEQVVEQVHAQSELRDAEAAMRSELVDDDLPQAYTRAAIYGCYADQLDAVEKAVAADNRAQVLQLAKAYQPVVRTWDDEAWKAAVASQVLVHSGSKRMLDWAGAYVLVPKLSETADAEQTELPHLRAGLSGSGPLAPAQQNRLLDTISVARGYNRAMSGASLALMKLDADDGLKIAPAKRKALLAEARATFGACVAEPSPERLDLSSQGPANTDAVLGRR